MKYFSLTSLISLFKVAIAIYRNKDNMKLLRISALVAAISSLGTIAHAGEWEEDGTQPALPVTTLAARTATTAVAAGYDSGTNTGNWQFKWKWVPDPLNPTETSPAVLVNRVFTYNNASLTANSAAGGNSGVDLWATVQTNGTPGVDVDTDGFYPSVWASNGSTMTSNIVGDVKLQTCRINASATNISSYIMQTMDSEYYNSGGAGNNISRGAFTVTTNAINIGPA